MKTKQSFSPTPLTTHNTQGIGWPVTKWNKENSLSDGTLGAAVTVPQSLPIFSLRDHHVLENRKAGHPCSGLQTVITCGKSCSCPFQQGACVSQTPLLTLLTDSLQALTVATWRAFRLTILACEIALPLPQFILLLLFSHPPLWGINHYCHDHLHCWQSFSGAYCSTVFL